MEVLFNKTNPSTALDINGNIRLNDLLFTNYSDPILSDTTSTLTQRWTALNNVVQNNIDISNTNSNNITALNNTITNLTSQINSLTSTINTLTLSSVKAYGRWTGSAVVFGSQFVNQSQCSFGTVNISGTNYYGTKIQLANSISGIRGNIQVTPDNGYTAYASFVQLSYPFEFVVVSFGGGAQPAVQNNPFFFTVI